MEMTTDTKMLAVIMSAATGADQRVLSGQMISRYRSTAIQTTLRLDEYSGTANDANIVRQSTAPNALDLRPDPVPLPRRHPIPSFVKRERPLFGAFWSI